MNIPIKIVYYSNTSKIGSVIHEGKKYDIHNAYLLNNGKHNRECEIENKIVKWDKKKIPVCKILLPKLKL